MDINLFSPFFHDWKANAKEAFELWIGSQPTSILSNSSLLQLPSSEIMLPMKRNDRLGVFSFRQTSFINLLSDNFLPRVAELALVYSMGRSMMLVFSQNRSWIEKDVFLIKLIKFVDNELKKIVKYRDGFQINIRWTDSRILQRFKTLFPQVCRLTDFLPCNRRHDVELSALAEKLPRQ